MRVRRLIQTEIGHLFGRVDALVAPGRSAPAPKIDQPLSGRTAAVSAAPQPGMSAIVQAGNLAGLPALVLPCGFASGLPLALQVVGAPFSENTLLAVGNEFQTRTGWHQKRPPGV
jgi:aspartyl-tRNA(Asn)/glutamyl-tRNA(Gln) amidotransferase subunit A